ncbi:MAG: PAS domain-containing protein [Gemmatimonadetes bacterium]|nr:PAS domain-containing protein [Gemmatimonadota bacterium]
MTSPRGHASESGRGRAPRGPGGGAPASESGIGPLAFLALTLVALAVVPVFVGRLVNEVEREIAEVLEPGREIGSDLTLLLARQMYRFQSFLLTGDEGFRQRYEEGMAAEEVLYERLRVLADGMDLDVRERLAALYTNSTRWHVIHQGVLSGGAGRDAYLEDLAPERQRFDDVLAAARDLEGALAAEVRAGRRRMERARAFQAVLTGFLVLLALGGTIALAMVARRLRSLADAAERRRRDAVRARRQVDAILEATGDGVLGVDLDGRVTVLNRAGAELLECSRKHAQGLDVHELLHGPAADHEREACPLLQALASGRRDEARDDRMTRMDGRTFPARWHVRPMTDGREVKGAVVTFTDMTEIRAAEDALHRAIAARDEVLGVVSHDLRNPVGTVGAAAELLAELDLPEASRREQLDIIRRTAVRMSRLIEDLLDVTRIDGGGLALAAAAEDPVALVRETLDQHRILAREAGIELVDGAREDLPPVKADRERILQALANLVGNALKFTPPGGRVTVRADADGPDGVLLSVEDTGEGIPPESLERLFDRFWQQRRAGRRGAGLGLAIARGIVESHGGELRVESELGRGSTFFFSLAIADRETEASAGTSAVAGSEEGT